MNRLEVSGSSPWPAAPQFTGFPVDRWRKDALCASAPDPDLWFAEPHDWRRVRQAQDVCSQCPVRAECLEFALQNDERYGIWGGQQFSKAPEYPCESGRHERTRENVYVIRGDGDLRFGCRDCDDEAVA